MLVNVAYIRVSTEEQSLERQREALGQFGIEKWYEEKISEKDTEGKQLAAEKDAGLCA